MNSGAQNHVDGKPEFMRPTPKTLECAMMNTYMYVCMCMHVCVCVRTHTLLLKARLGTRRRDPTAPALTQALHNLKGEARRLSAQAQKRIRRAPS